MATSGSVECLLHYAEREEVHRSERYKFLTGPELAFLVHANKKRYSESATDEHQAKQRLSDLQSEEECL